MSELLLLLMAAGRYAHPLVIRSALIDPGPDLVVCDEGHKIKNLNTDIAAALGAIKTRYVFISV